MIKKRILILDGYARQTLPMTKGFKEIGCHVTVAYFSKLDVGYASKHPDRKYKFNCHKEDYQKQYEIAKGLIESGEYDLVVPMTDYSAMYLAANKEYLSQYAYIAVNEAPIFDMAINKLNTMFVCEKNGIPAPRTLFTDNPLEDIKKSDLRFPLVVKPQTACGSIGFNIVTTIEHLQRVLKQYDNSNGALFVQECVPSGGNQYNVQMFLDKKGNRKAGIATQKVRWFPIDGGAATCVHTITNNELLLQCEKLLKTIGWNGYADIDLIEDVQDGEYKIIEINPRISANVKLCYAAGVNISQLIYENAFEDVVVAQTEYQIGKTMRCLLTDLLWFIKSKSRLASQPSWFSCKNTCDVIFSQDDLKPMFCFVVQSALNFGHAMKKRKRQ